MYKDELEDIIQKALADPDYKFFFWNDKEFNDLELSQIASIGIAGGITYTPSSVDTSFAFCSLNDPRKEIG